MSEKLASAEARQAAERAVVEFAKMRRAYLLENAKGMPESEATEKMITLIADSYADIVRERDEVRAAIAWEDGLCAVCKQPTSSISGNPAEWPHWLPIRGSNGKKEVRHMRCLVDQLESLKAAERLNRELVEASRRVLEYAKDKNHVCYAEDTCGRCDAIERAEAAIKSAKQGEVGSNG